MNSGNTLPPYSPHDEAIQAALAHEIDVARDQAELAGDWREDVTVYDFFFNHGIQRITSQQEIPAVMATWRRMGTALAAAGKLDVVGVEAAGANVPPEAVVAIFNRLNDIAAQWAGDTRLQVDIRSSIDVAIIGMFQGMRAAGVDVLPRVVPIDGFADGAVQQAISRSNDESLSPKEKFVTEAGADRLREGAVVRQAHTIAHGVPVDGEKHAVALVQGSAHYRTATALEALGAPTIRFMVDQPIESPVSQAKDIVRQDGADALSEAEAQTFATADMLGNGLFALAGSPLQGQTQHERANEQVARVAELGSFSLAGLRGELVEELQADFDAFTEFVGRDDPEMVSSATNLVTRIMQGQ